MNIKEGMEGAVTVRRWRRGSKLTRPVAAGELGLSERMLAYYESGERPVPRTVLLAIRALSAGLDATPEAGPPSRERWVVLVRNVLDYGRGDPVVGRMLRERDRIGIEDFLAFVKRGPDPDLAFTDPGLFQSLRSAVTKAQLSGLASYSVSEGVPPPEVERTSEVETSDGRQENSFRLS